MVVNKQYAFLFMVVSAAGLHTKGHLDNRISPQSEQKMCRNGPALWPAPTDFMGWRSYQDWTEHTVYNCIILLDRKQRAPHEALAATVAVHHQQTATHCDPYPSQGRIYGGCMEGQYGSCRSGPGISYNIDFTFDRSRCLS